jgi:hypothetical protein
VHDVPWPKAVEAKPITKTKTMERIYGNIMNENNKGMTKVGLCCKALDQESGSKAYGQRKGRQNQSKDSIMPVVGKGNPTILVSILWRRCDSRAALARPLPSSGPKTAYVTSPSYTIAYEHYIVGQAKTQPVDPSKENSYIHGNELDYGRQRIGKKGCGRWDRRVLVWIWSHVTDELNEIIQYFC